MPSLDRTKSVAPSPTASETTANARPASATPASASTSGSALGPKDRRYWKSVERLVDSPSVREALQAEAEAEGDRGWSEFPAGASDAPEGVSRRTMLSIMGASFAFAGLQGCRRPVETIVPYVNAPEHVIPGIPRHFATTLGLGTSAAGVVVESHENRPTKIEGNELHPSSQGAASVWTQASILGLYDPDRSTKVRRRAAGETDLRPSEWKLFADSWRSQLETLDASGGEGLMVLSTGYSSPTLARLRAAFGERFPNARFEVYEPAGDHTVIAGCSQATGQDCRPVLHLDRATRILALDADLLGLESDAVRCARGWSDGRRITSTEGEMNRLYAVESTFTLTGGMADHRVRLAAGKIPAFAAAVAAGVGVAGVTADGLGPALGEKVAAIVADLRDAGASALVAAGRRQTPEIHALALAINQALGSLGNTVTLHPAGDTGHGGAFSLQEIADAMRGGSVTALVMLGGNPVYDAPGDVDFVGALAAVPYSVHLSSHVDETSHAASWHLNQAHDLETWGDARANDGTASVTQPLIAPLWGGHSAIEVLSALISADATVTPGHDLVQETWRGLLATDSADGDFDKAWRKVLHDGVLVASASDPLEVSVETPAALPGDDGSNGLEVTFHPSVATYDGRFANVGWLQEMPDPLTKITWDNAALVSPATADDLGVEMGDVVTLSLDGRTVDAPVFVMPGQADGSIALSLGYGRSAAGRVGNGVGYDANGLRGHAAAWTAQGATADRAGRHYELAQTQEHWDMAGRDHHLLHEATVDEYRDPDFEANKPAKLKKLDPAKSHQLFPDPVEYTEGPQWGMAIDLNACTGCNACVIACQSENNVPIVGRDQVSKGREMHWLRVDRYFSGSLDEPEVVMMPVPCMHCENAPCEQVCPVAATVHDRQGLNAMVYNRCIGTRYCSNNCPYKVRRFNFFNYTKDTPELLAMAMNPDVTVRSRGVMEKCSYCLQRISQAQIEAKRADRPLADGDVRTACQQTCPTQAISFGDILDESSVVAAHKGSSRDYVLLGELNNRPRTSFLTRLRNPNPALGGAEGNGHEEQTTEAAAEHHG